MPKIFIDRTPLKRYPEFRRIWLSYGVSAIGTQLSTVAVAYQVYILTKSTVDVGLISLAQLGPAILAPVIGGAIADSMDRRKLLVITSLLAFVSAGLLGVNASLHHPMIWAIFVLAAIAQGVQGIDSPARTSLMMSIPESDLLVSASALRSVLGQFASVAGPAIGGVLIVIIGTKGVYWINAFSFLVVIRAVVSVSAHTPKAGMTKFSFQSIADGFRFIKDRQAIQGCLVSDLNATILGMPTSIFPALALVQFHGGSKTVGILYAAPGAGAAMATFFSGWTSRIRRPGLAIIVSIVIWGAAITAFGFAKSLVIAVIMLAIAGFGDQVSAIFRASIIQIEASDQLRGRVTSLQQACNASGPRLGNTEAGLVAGFSTPQISVISGGIGSLIGIAIIAAAMPKFLSYEIKRKRSEIEIDSGPSK